MTPTSPVLPANADTWTLEVVLAKDQPEYLPLPVLVAGDSMIHHWRLSWSDRIRLLWSGSLWITTLTFGSRFQPILPSSTPPEVEIK